MLNIENTVVQLRKGILELNILQIISCGEIYASDLLTELTSAQLIVVEGTVYPLLNRLSKAGLLSYVWKESTGGPPRKYFQITKEGKVFQEELLQHWKVLVKATSTIHTKNKLRNE